MSKSKDDLTRIEDLGEFIHELSQDDQQDQDALASELPDLPGAEDSPFGAASEISEESPFEFSSSTFENDSTFEDHSNDDDHATFEDTPSFESDSSFGEDSIEESIIEEPSSFESSTYFDESSPSEETSPLDVNPHPTSFQKKEDTSSFKVPESSSENPSTETTDESINKLVEETFQYTPSPDFKTPETFEDVKKFAESSSFSASSAEGNPSFSVLIRNVRYIEDVTDIVALLKELQLLSDSEEQTKARLMRGSLLVPRISEFAAIFLTHKLRRFDIDIQIGLSDELHPPKFQEAAETGIVSKHNLYQNQGHHFHFDDPKLDLSQIIVAATPSLEGYQVIRYMGVATEHKLLEGQIVEDEDSGEIPLHYKELALKLKAHALKNNSNAIVGLNYQLTPLPSEFGHTTNKYRLTCTGNLVWVNKL